MILNLLSKTAHVWQRHLPNWERHPLRLTESDGLTSVLHIIQNGRAVPNRGAKKELADNLQFERMRPATSGRGRNEENTIFGYTDRR